MTKLGDKMKTKGLTTKAYKKLIKTVSAGPIPKSLLYEIVKRDGHTLLFSLSKTVGNWYPASEGESKPGYIQVHNGEPIAFLAADEVAILTEK
jgi:hypothetical protein